MPLAFQELIIIVGVSQALFFALLLLTAQSYLSRPNQLLAIAVILIALITVRVAGFIEHILFVEFFEYFAIEYLFPPFLLFYVTGSLKMSLPLRVSFGFLAPFILFSLLGTLISLADFYEMDAMAYALEATEALEMPVFASLLVAVCIMSIQKTRKSKSPIYFKKWIYALFTSFVLLVGALLLAEFFETVLGLDYWYIIPVGISFLLMGVSYHGISRLSTSIHRSDQKARPSLPPRKNVALSKSHFQKISELIIEKKLYQNPAITREIIGAHLNLSVSTVSRILRDNQIQSLNDFVNQYRIQLAKKMLQDPTFDVYSLEAIGKEVGFKSRSAFYSVFKKNTGLTPGVFKKNERFCSPAS